MSDARSPLTQYADIERALTDLAPRVAYPPTPDLAGTIRARIAAEPAPARPGWSWPALLKPRRLAVAFLVLLIIAVGALAISPDLRTAVAKRLGIHGIEIIFVDETPTPAASPVGTTLLLGEPMTLAEAQSRVGYVIQIPAELGPPDEVYLRQLEAGPMVTLLYRPRSDLPEAEETGVGALLMQFPATSDIDQIVKRVTMGTGSVLRVPVKGVTGFWVMGSSELVISQDPSAGFEQSVSRRSADVLIWEQDGTAYRLEVNLLMSDAITIAESLQPPLSTPSPP
jgi:hypothetical protein